MKKHKWLCIPLSFGLLFTGCSAASAPANNVEASQNQVAVSLEEAQSSPMQEHDISQSDIGQPAIPTVDLEQAYQIYVWPVSAHGGSSVLFLDWDIPDNPYALDWDATYECLTRTVGGKNITSIIDLPENEDEYHVYPADEYEDMLQQYFDVSTETLRAQEAYYGKLYDADTHTYRTKGFLGSGHGANLEVMEVTENADGSLTLDISSDIGISIQLTVMPDEQGGFRYISNRRLDS